MYVIIFDVGSKFVPYSISISFLSQVMDQQSKNRKKERALEGVSSDAETNGRQTSPTDRNLFHAGLNSGGQVQDCKEAQRIMDAYWKHAALQTKLLFPSGTRGYDYFHGENVQRYVSSPSRNVASPSRDVVSPSGSVRSPQETMASPSGRRSPLEGMASPPINVRVTMERMENSMRHRPSPRPSPRNSRSPIEDIVRPRNVNESFSE